MSSRHFLPHPHCTTTRAADTHCHILTTPLYASIPRFTPHHPHHNFLKDCKTYGLSYYGPSRTPNLYRTAQPPMVVVCLRRRLLREDASCRPGQQRDPPSFLSPVLAPALAVVVVNDDGVTRCCSVLRKEGEPSCCLIVHDPTSYIYRETRHIRYRKTDAVH